MAHYETVRITTIEQLRTIFTDKADYTMNWLFLSTSGVHGDYGSLDNLLTDGPDDDGEYSITVLVVKPRLVLTLYGHIAVAPDDIPWLRSVVTKTLAGIAESQRGNTED